MKVYKQSTVYEESIKRIERLFDEFENIIVACSGGKDSTVCLELTLEVARRRGRLPLKVLFIDQEAEWQHTVDYIREIMYRPEVDPVWLQVPIRLFNCTSQRQDWLYCWDEKERDKWVHPKDPISLKENVFGTDRFKPMFGAVGAKIFGGQPYASIGGVRADESITRFGAISSGATYKDITWGAKEKRGYTFYPIYDWKFDDVWTYIGRSGCNYNRVYDLMFNYGIPSELMRVSNLHHETAYRALFFLQEVERKTYDRLVRRLPGIATFNQMQEDGIFPKKLPEMFASWAEYRDYLLETIVREDVRDNFRKLWRNQDGEDWAKEHVQEIMANDWTGTKNHNRNSKFRIVEKIKNGRFKEKYDG